jgi:single-strand DNA-binding protein
MPFPRNDIEIVGNLGKDAEMRYTPGGVPVTQFSVACTREFEQSGDKVKETTWLQVTCWKKTAEQTANLKKGQQVMVKGRLVPDKSTGGPRIWSRKDGTAGASFDVVAQEVWLSLYTREEGEHYTNEASQLQPEEDQIPF